MHVRDSRSLEAKAAQKGGDVAQLISAAQLDDPDRLTRSFKRHGKVVEVGHLARRQGDATRSAAGNVGVSNPSIVETEDAFHNACKLSGKMNGPNMPKIFLLRMPVVSQIDMERTVQFRAGPRNGDLAAFLVYLVNGKTMCFGKGNHLAQVFR
jgi:hypothetical protein